ncbi:MAG: DEAD/DEAH box helicase [Candidatus Microsaccharimonas sossegonensis]|uniref:DEAD/DEAH box helicase n=1 Tax=Candidatus Microsaccharimonas sossegonensis TaxID=2506948 RepID=A0A4Q0AHL8_9BACT|nr:MAG: DEAD/DEAH box helicase [Candidatus Microsaccharimonas sossegonensis]
MPYGQHRSSAKPRGARPGHRSFGGSHQRRGSGNGVRRGAYIHPSKFINKAVSQAEEVVYESKHAFKDFAFSPDVQHNIIEKGYKIPSAIQDQAIPLILEGKDVIGLANTGTGKTAAFILPIIEKIHAKNKLSGQMFYSVLIMAPTRELAVQIDEQFREFSRGMRLYSALCVGGMNIDRQIRDLRRRPHVIIGTPGRLKDLMKRSELKLDSVSYLVLDEADRMLDMGFINDIREIVDQTPRDRQTLFFSATITPTIQALVNTFLNNPVEVSVRTADTSEHVEQDIVEARDKDHKLETLVTMLAGEDFDKVLVFGETKFGVQRLSDHLEHNGFSSVAIHGNKSQSQRQRALKSFKDNKVNIMVATDVAARGLDIPNVSHVINFDQPATYEDYVHRIGRTGRGGASGKAFTFVPTQTQNRR